MPRTQSAPLRLPEAFRRRRTKVSHTQNMKRLLRGSGLVTVCEEARCPNMAECFDSGTATFMILGDTCTRKCDFCSVTTGRPQQVDASEPQRVAAAAAALNLKHVVMTSVDRDDLRDGGAHHWAECIHAVKSALPSATVEVLTPDFHTDKGRGAPLVAGRPFAALDVVLDAQPHVFNHNIESVDRLYASLRPQSNYARTQAVLKYAAKRGHPAVKSGLMVGLGETDREVLETLDTLKALGVHIVTIGQYMRPSLKHAPVARYVDDAAYARFVAHGEALGFTHVFAGPFVRSSYHAAEATAAHASAMEQARPAGRPLAVLSS